MIRGDTTGASRKFLRRCGVLFASSGWATSALQDQSVDWKIDKWHLHFLVTCGSGNMLDFISVTRIVELMEAQVARWNLSKSATPFFILDFELGGKSLIKLADQGIAAFYAEEIGLVTSLARLENDIPADLDNRQLLLLKHCPWACLAISARLRQRGDLPSAFEWAMRAVPDNGRPNPRINRIVFDIFFNAQRYEDAERFATDRLEWNHSDPEMLRALEKLAEHRGNLADVELIKARIANLPENAPGATFDTLIERQQQRQSLTDQTPAFGSSGDSLSMQGSKRSGDEKLSMFRKMLGKLRGE